MRFLLYELCVSKIGLFGKHICNSIVHKISSTQHNYVGLQRMGVLGTSSVRQRWSPQEKSMTVYEHNFSIFIPATLDSS